MPHAFRPYTAVDRGPCLTLFDSNCPEFFAHNERADYVAFLDAVGAKAVGGSGTGYTVIDDGEALVGAYGVCPGTTADECRLTWILLAPAAQGRGLGRAIMARVVAAARAQRAAWLRIAASHKSAPFFARFGAVVASSTPNGWGPGMHRIDMDLAVGRPGAH